MNEKKTEEESLKANLSPEEAKNFMQLIERLLTDGAEKFIQSFGDTLEEDIKSTNNSLKMSLYELEKICQDEITKKYNAEHNTRLSFEEVARIEGHADLINDNPLNINVTPREQATNKGAIMKLDGVVCSFSNEELQNAFNSFSIKTLTEYAQKDDNFSFEADGEFIISGEEEQEIKKEIQNQQDKNKIWFPMDEINLATLMILLRAAILTSGDEIENTQDNNIIIYLPALYKELKRDPRTYSKGRNSEETIKEMRFKNFLELIMPFDNAIGILKGVGIYRVLSFSSYDEESDTVTINTPYIFKALNIALANKKDKEALPFNSLFHPDIIQEKNKAAVEVANRIIVGLLQRGIIHPKKDDTGKTYILYEPKFTTIINDCPILKKDLENCENNPKTARQNFNNKLKRTFEAAYKILKDKSEVYKKFVNLNIDEKRLPSRSTMDSKMYITFTGIKKDI